MGLLKIMTLNKSLPQGNAIRHLTYLKDGFDGLDMPKQITIPIIHRELGVSVPKPEPRILESYNPRYCPCCQKESMVSIQRLPKRGPPKAVFPTLSTQL